MSDQLATLVAQLKERRAYTFQERIKSLDIRDEIWRKYIELNKGSSFDAIAAQRTGLCPDMCCERERLTREYQRLYKSYELDPYTRALNHSLMVTEYSRASADQAMPSPYDLRSGPVLLNTMNYLITNIMDKFDQEREQGDWYNFLWDRLRAIRKEITQQHIRDENAIEILEQCARFHIFCSAFLSEYSRDLFDPNLNDKMLIDCLNQLRDCYLTHKQQNNYQALKNLSEFSSYMLLINLKEDNETLLRIRSLIKDITNDHEINIALDIHRSLLLNNTTKFFSLIETKATLLQSCLLHRYFNLIRLKRLSSLIASTRNNIDEIRLNDLTDMLGMDTDDETKDFLEQLGYSITNTNPLCFIIPAKENVIEQQPIKKLSQKLIKIKYNGNLKDIITGYSNTPVVIPDTNIEDSFDMQGYFIGKLPFDTDKIPTPVLRRPPPEQQPQPQPQPVPSRSQPPLFTKRPPSESAFRSLAATTTTNTFAIRSRPIETTNLFTNVTTTVTTPPSPFRFGGFNSTSTTTTTSLFPPSSVPKSIFSASPQFSNTPKTTFPIDTQPTKVIQYLPKSAEPSPVIPIISQTVPKTPDPIIQPPPPVARRLSMNSMETFVDELYEQMIDSLIQETTYNIFDDLISQWNNLTCQTVKIFDEFLLEEITSIAHDYYDNVEFHQKMLTDTLIEEYERKRRKYLRKKYFYIWFDNVLQAKEERFILNDFQLKYHFLNNEQLFEFLTGIQLMLDHNLSIEQTSDILKSRRHLKRSRLQKIEFLSNLFFEEFLQNELHTIVIESKSELNLRQKIFENSLKKQFQLKHEHYLQMKYFSLWIIHYRQRKQLIKQQLSLNNNNNNNKRTNIFLQLRSNKKLKENNQQYNEIKNSYDQLTTDINQIQLVINKLTS